MPVLGIIPARLGGTRLPNKVLLRETGKSVLEHVWEQARQAKSLDMLTIAFPFKDREEIRSNVWMFTKETQWGWVTDDKHPTGTNRCAEVAESCKEYDIIVNVQSDQPLLNPAHIDLVVRRLQDDPGIDIATLAAPLRGDDLDNPNVVKVWTDPDSRRATCFVRNMGRLNPRLGMSEVSYRNLYRHVGIYAYRRACLLHLAGAPRPYSEVRDSLEQRRMEREECRIGVEVVDHAEYPVDDAASYAAFVARYRELHPASATV